MIAHNRLFGDKQEPEDDPQSEEIERAIDKMPHALLKAGCLESAVDGLRFGVLLNTNQVITFSRFELQSDERLILFDPGITQKLGLIDVEKRFGHQIEIRLDAISAAWEVTT